MKYNRLYSYMGPISSIESFNKQIEEILEFKKLNDKDIEKIILGSMSLSFQRLTELFGTSVIDPITFYKVGYSFNEGAESFTRFLSNFISHEILDDGEPLIMYYHHMRTQTCLCRSDDVIIKQLMNRQKEIKASKFVARFASPNFRKKGWFIEGNSANIAELISEAIFDAQCQKTYIYKKNELLSPWGEEFIKLWKDYSE